MGGLEVSNKSLRCGKCLEIRRMTIIPEYPEPKLKMECRCDDKECKLYEFLTEYKKKENFKIKCAKCQTDNPKEPKYCYKCQKIYCVKCLDFHSQLSNLSVDTKEGENNNDDVMNLIGHKVISIEKVDFHCILHENEKFIGFCKKCLLNFCQKCKDENLHKDHDICLFSEILLDHKKKVIIKGCIDRCHEKMEHNEKICKKIKKKIKNEENKNQLSSLVKENKKINEKILEYFEDMYEMYEKIKNRNYSIIFNARRNTRFNIDKITFDKKDIEEEDAVTLIEYLKNDFVLHTEYSLKKKEEKKQNQKLENEEIYNNIVSINDNVPIQNESENDNKNKQIDTNNIIIENKEGIKNEIKIEEKKEESKKEKKEREKREKEEKARKEKEEKERLKKEEKEKKEHDKKEKEEKARKEKEEKEKAKKEEKEKKEHDKKEKEEKARKEKEEKERLKKEEKEKKEHDKKEKEEKARKEKEDKEKAKKEEKEKKEKEKSKKEDKKDKKGDKKEDKKGDKKGDKKEEKKDIDKKRSSNNINDKTALFKQMMETKGGGMKGRPATQGRTSSKGNTEKPIKIEVTRNEGNTVELLNNIKVAKVVKKKPKKVNFE